MDQQTEQRRILSHCVFTLASLAANCRQSTHPPHDARDPVDGYLHTIRNPSGRVADPENHWDAALPRE